MIKLDNIPIREFGLRVQREHDHPLVGEATNNIMTIPGMTGAWDFGSQLGPKQFNIPLGMLEHNKYEKQRKLNEFVAFLFDSYVRPREFKLSFDYEPEKYYKVKLASGFSPQRLLDFVFFNLPLIALDPFKYSSAHAYDKDIYYGDVQKGDYYPNPMSFHWKYNRQYSVINNYSPYETEFVIEIEGTVINSQVINLVTNEVLTLPNITNEKIKVDSKSFIITKNDKNAFTESNGHFFNIQPGKVGFLFEGEEPHATVSYKWMHKFI